MMKRIAALAVVSLLGTLGDLRAQSPVLDRVLAQRELRVATSGNQPPFNAVSKDGQLIGFEVDLARLLAEAMNVNLTLTSMPFPDLLPALKQGRVDMVLSGLAITPERIRDVAFVGPYVLSGKSVLTDSATLVSMKTPRDLDKPELTLLALENSTSEEYVKQVAPSAKLVTVTNYDAGIDLLLEDEADAMIADMPVCVLTVLRNPRADLATPSRPFNVEPVGVAVPANDARFQNLVDSYIEAFEQTGLLDELREKWLESNVWLELLP